MVASLENVAFNSVLINYYRGGADSMGWHSDDEKIYGDDPVIASVTFLNGTGTSPNSDASRPFELRNKRDHKLKYSIPLRHGSLFVMAGATQKHWQHQVPKLSATTLAKAHKEGGGERINLTFRQTKGSVKK